MHTMRGMQWMLRYRLGLASLGAPLTLLAGLPGPEARADTPPPAAVLESYGKLPLLFEENRGQADSRVRFLARGSGTTLFLTPAEAVLQIAQASGGEARHPEACRKTGPGWHHSGSSVVLRVSLVGANPAPEVSGIDELAGRSNYFIGNDPRRWQTNVPQYAGVRYRGVYPGIDVAWYGRRRQIEHDFVVRPGADPRSIRLRFQGAENLCLDHDGNVVVKVRGGKLIEKAPVVYQEVDGSRRSVPGRYRLKGRDVAAFDVGAYDRSRPLVIDPTLLFSTYLGGSGGDYGQGINLDGAGNAYVTGYTGSTNFPVAGAYQSSNAGAGFPDVFVTKLSASGSALVYSTYLGGSSYDYPYGISVDGAGNAYVAGYTESSDFPVANAYQASNGGTSGAFVTKLSASGSALVYSTYLGGSSGDQANGIAADAAGNAYVTGYTASTDFPVSNAYQATYAGGADAFVTKLSASGSALVYSTYLGGSGGDQGNGIAIDAAANAYVTGNTTSADFPIVNAYQASYAGGFGGDGFVTKLSASGSTLVYSTYLGGSGYDYPYGIALDSAGGAYLTGFTASTNFPIANAYQASHQAGGNAAFVTRLGTSGSALVYSTYLGQDSTGYGIAVDGAGSAWVVGDTASTIPIANAYQTSNAGQYDAFVTELDPSGSTLVYSTYLGGSDYDHGRGIALDLAGSAYVTGDTSSPDFPLANAYQASNAGSPDVFVSALLPGAGLALPTITAPSAGATIGVSGVTFGWDAVSGAAGYDLRIFDSNNGRTVFSGSLVGGSSISTLISLPNGSYIFAVRACNASGFSDATCGTLAARTFAVSLIAPTEMPTIDAPLNGANLTSSTQTLSWTSVTRDPALSTMTYEVLLEDLAKGETTLQINVPDPETSTIFSLGSSTSYRLRVRACQAACGPFSAPVGFSVTLGAVPTAAPTVNAPAITGGNQLDASWSAVPGADLYQIQVVQPTGGPGGGALTIAAQQVSTTSVSLPVPAGQANIVVAACNGDGCGPFGSPVSINPAGPNPATPNPGTPMAGTVVSGPTALFTWNRIDGDDGSNTTYRVYVQDLSRQAAALDVRTTDNFYGAYFKAEGARYDAVVIANPGCTGAGGACSGPETAGPAVGFNVAGTSSDAPTMVSPAHNSTRAQGNIQLGWSPVAGATLYEYFVAVQGQFSPTVRGVTPGLFVQVPLTTGTGNSIYSGIVRACPAGATCVAGSDAGWGPWSNQAGPGVTNFTVTP